jgi:ActR/RegA family two-component response regulator
MEEKKVLIVDPDVGFAEELKAALAGVGYKGYQVSDFSMAIDFLREKKIITKRA